MGGRGSGSTAGASAGARSEAKLQHQIASIADNRKLITEGHPFGESAGGILNDRMAPSMQELNRLDAQMWSENSAWRAALTPAEKQAISKWNTPMVYSELNHAVREGHTLTPEQQKLYDGLKGAIEKSTVPHNMTVYRGVKGDTSVEQAKGLVGAELSGKSKGIFLASSASLTRAQHFTGNPSHPGGAKEGTVYKITVPKGAHAAYLTASGAGGLLNEHELLFSPTAHFKVTGYSRAKSKSGTDTSGYPTYSKNYTTLHMVYLGDW